MSESSDSRRRVPVERHPGIYKRGGRYQVAFTYRGKLKWRSFRTLSEAKRFKAQAATGDAQPTSRKTFKAYAEEWLESYTGRTAKGLSEATRESYGDLITRLAVPFFGTTPLERIDPPMLKSYIGHLAGQGFAPSSVRRVYAPVRAMLATAFEDGLIRINPAAGVRVVVPDNRTKVPLWLRPEQTKALLAAMPPEHADLALFLAATGCRISEALAACWQDIGPDDQGRPSLTIPKSKTAAGERAILLSPETARRLTKRRTEGRFRAEEDRIFPAKNGNPMDPHNFRSQIFNPAAKRAGVPWATPHKLRHGLASLMASHGLSAAQIATHLGHADGGVLALKTYIHTDGLDSADFIDQALGG